MVQKKDSKMSHQWITTDLTHTKWICLQLCNICYWYVQFLTLVYLKNMKWNNTHTHVTPNSARTMPLRFLFRQCGRKETEDYSRLVRETWTAWIEICSNLPGWISIMENISTLIKRSWKQTWILHIRSSMKFWYATT